MRVVLGRTVVLTAAVLMSIPSGDAAGTPGGSAAPEYYFDDWRVPQLWASGARGQGVTIAEIDTGIDTSAGVFDGRLLPGKDFGVLGGDGQIDRDTNPFGHGTSMASIMVGSPGQFGIRGLAPKAKVLPVAIALAGTTDAASDDHLPEAIRWAADDGAKIISMSLGGIRAPAQNRVACPEDEQQAIYHALREGAVLIAASGNLGTRGSAVEEPGVCLGVVAVGAVDRTRTVADFSSRHPYVTLSAPGVAVPSIGPGGTAFSGDGTSQATALASAVAALVWSKYPRLSSSQLVGRLLATLDRRRATRDPAYGYGTINAYRAVTAAVPVNAPDPVYALALAFAARDGAHAAVPPAPRAIARADASPGTYSVGSSPPRFAARVLGAAEVAAGGLLLLLVLLVVGVRGRRRRRRSLEAPGELPNLPDDDQPDDDLPQPLPA
jgi:subtilisin family serine protease